MLYLCLFILACSAVGLVVMSNCKKEAIKPKRRSLYEIPSSFWDEYNTITLDIYYMTNASAETIRYKIEDFEYKYSQIVDYQVYNDRMGEILRSYKTKKEFINNKNK
jgi:hypothetical protein